MFDTETETYKMALLAGNMTQKLALAALGVTLALTPMMAQAKGSKHGPRASFEQLDANGDGSLTQAEMQAHAKARFASADSNGDGNISRAELEAQAKSNASERATRRIDRMMERLDTNSDGQISASEMEAAADKRGGKRGERMFKRADADGNGSISKAEFDAMAKKGGKKKRDN